MASVARVATSEALVEALQKSGLLAAEQMAKARQAAAATSDPKALARQLIKSGLITLWQAHQLLHGYYLLVVGKYKLLDQLASGATGRVYLAEHMQIQRRHALKILSRRHAAKPEVLKRFLADAERLCALDHRNLSHIYDVNQDGDKYFLVMEYVEGQSLQKVVEKSGPVAPALAALYALQAAEGLAHAHEQGVFHGDLQPASMLLDASGTVKITGIGQSRLVSPPAAGAADETTEAAALAATIYRAPELRSDSAAADARCDVYSLGSALCFLLAGKPAADAADARTLLEKTDVPADLVQLCVSMMAEDPGQRPAAMTDVLTALASLQLASPPPAGEPPTAEATGESPPAAAVPKRIKKPLVAKPLDERASAAKSINPQPAAQEVPDFALKGTKARRGAKPAAKAVATAGGEENAAGEPAAKRTSRMPLIIGGAIGGSVLVLGGIVLAVVLAMNWLGGPRETAVADAKAAKNQTAAQTPAAANPESNPETNPESNLETNPELNPTTAATAAPGLAAPGAAGGNALTPPSAVPAAVPAQVTQLPEGPPPSPMPAAAPMPPGTEPAAPAEQTAAVKPEPAEPAPPAKVAAPPAAPFAGFAKAVSLPKLEPGPMDPPSDPLAPLALGPCVVDEKAIVIAQLKGGEGAIRGSRQKFELAAAQDGTALRDWEISLASGAAKAIVALLSVKDDQLTFQWTPEAAKEPGSALLCNCGLKLSAGPDQHEVALREPIVGEPLVVNLERIGSSVKWNIDLLPDPKKIFIEVARLDGEFLEHKFKQRQTLEGSDRTELWTGSAEDSMPLGLRIDSSVAAQAIQIKASPQYQLKAMRQPQLLVKRELGVIEKQIDSSRFIANKRIEAAKKAKAEAQKTLSERDLERVNAADEQLTELKSLIEGLDGKAKIHFRVFYETGEGPIDLLVTEEAPLTEEGPAEEDEKPAADDADVEPAAKKPANAGEVRMTARRARAT